MATHDMNDAIRIEHKEKLQNDSLSKTDVKFFRWSSLTRYHNQLTTETGTFIRSVYYYMFSEKDTSNFTSSKTIPNLTYYKIISFEHW